MGQFHRAEDCALDLSSLVLGENEPFGLSPCAVAAGRIHSVRGWAPPIDAEFRKCLHLHHPMPTAAGTPTGRPFFLGIVGYFVPALCQILHEYKCATHVGIVRFR
jgi:hypothetical protein